MQHKKDEYLKIKLKITALYFVIIFVIVGFFSLIVINDQFRQLERFNNIRRNPVTQQTYPNILPENIEEITKTINDIKTSLILDVIILDLIILFISAVLSFYLSGKTLRPIIQSLDRQKRFVADASHEIKTPLTTMNTEAQVLARSKKVSQEEYKDFLQSVIEEVGHLTNLTNDMLVLAKSDNTPTLDMKKVNVKNEIDSCVNKFTPIAKDKNILINIDFKIENPEITTDKEKFHRLICILVDNAIKYNKNDGNISIIIAQESNEKISISVADTGVGIAKDKMSKIFDRFYRVSEDRNVKGFGLGLSIAKELAHQLRVEIHVVSKQNEGTTFKMIFPK